MLYTIAVMLLALWLLGLATGMLLGGAIHLLVVLSVALMMLRIFRVFMGPPRATSRI